MYETDEVLHDVGYGVLRCSFGKGARAWVGSIFFSGAYENFAHTFENSGYTLTVEAEGHSKRRVYGAFLVACQLTKVPSRLRWSRISAPSAIIWPTRRRRCCLP